MPLRWVAPDVFMTLSAGRHIYHTYKDEYGDICLDYWYTTDETEDNKYKFDIRDLSTYFTNESHNVIIAGAVVLGELKFPE